MKNEFKIVLLSPKGPLYRHKGGIFGRGLRYLPLTLPTLAALVPRELEASVLCIDEGVENIPDELDADLIGITVITGTAPRAYMLADHFRNRGIPVVLGGPHVTLVPEDAAPHADSIVIGYAEEEWPRLLRDFIRGTMAPVYRQSPDLKLEGFPPPDRSVMKSGRYLTRNTIEATRGCPHVCSFCVVPYAWGGQLLHRPVCEVVNDISAMKSRRVLFLDLNLIGDRDYACALFRALIPLHIQWFGLSTIRISDDPELLALAAASGCRGLLIGFESLSSGSLREVSKGFNHPEEYAKAAKTLHGAGIAIQGCFVFGLDEHTSEVFMRTAKFAVDIGIDLPRFAVLTPFPGTGLFRRLEDEGRIRHRNWELYDGQHVVFQPKQLSVDELQAGIERAWLYAYRWTSIGKRLSKSAAPLPVAVVSNLGYRFYARRLHRFYNCDWPLAAGMTEHARAMITRGQKSAASAGDDSLNIVGRA